MELFLLNSHEKLQKIPITIFHSYQYNFLLIWKPNCLALVLFKESKSQALKKVYSLAITVTIVRKRKLVQKKFLQPIIVPIASLSSVIQIGDNHVNTTGLLTL